MRKAIALSAMTLLVACDPGPPKGQVLARVGTEEITRRDMQVELAATDSALIVDPQAQAAALDQIIARKLMAREARTYAVNRSPEYLAQMRRARELLLASEYADLFEDRIKDPDPARLAAFIAANPQMFAERRVFIVDRVRANVPDGARPSLRGVTDNPDLVARLTGLRIAPIRKPAVVDSATLAPGAAQSLAARLPGQASIRWSGPVIESDATMAVYPIPVAADQQRSLAKEILRKRALDTLVAEKVAELRANTRLEVQPALIKP